MPGGGAVPYPARSVRDSAPGASRHRRPRLDGAVLIARQHPVAAVTRKCYTDPGTSRVARRGEQSAHDGDGSRAGGTPDRGGARRPRGRCRMSRTRSPAADRARADDFRSPRAVWTRRQSTARTLLRRGTGSISAGALRPGRLQARARARPARGRPGTSARLHPVVPDLGSQRRARPEAARGRRASSRRHLRHRVPEPEQRGAPLARPHLPQRLRPRPRTGGRSGRPRREHHDPRRLGSRLDASRSATRRPRTCSCWPRTPATSAPWSW